MPSFSSFLYYFTGIFWSAAGLATLEAAYHRAVGTRHAEFEPTLVALMQGSNARSPVDMRPKQGVQKQTRTPERGHPATEPPDADADADTDTVYIHVADADAGDVASASTSISNDSGQAYGTTASRTRA